MAKTASPDPGREIAVMALQPGYPGDMLEEVIRFAFDQLCWKRTDAELEDLLTELLGLVDEERRLMPQGEEQMKEEGVQPGASRATRGPNSPATTSTGAPSGADQAEPDFAPCDFYMLWTKTGRLPRFTHSDAEVARQEARRLAQKSKGRTFIVLRGFEKIRYGEEDLDGPPHVHPDKLLIGELLEACKAVQPLGDASLRAAITSALKPHERESFDRLLDQVNAAIAKASGASR